MAVLLALDPSANRSPAFSAAGTAARRRRRCSGVDVIASALGGVVHALPRGGSTATPSRGGRWPAGVRLAVPGRRP
ncbi:MAG: hypothetical protein R3A52_27515 [Polyangiales bacterium]